MAVLFHGSNFPSYNHSLMAEPRVGTLLSLMPQSLASRLRAGPVVSWAVLIPSGTTTYQQCESEQVTQLLHACFLIYKTKRQNFLKGVLPTFNEIMHEKGQVQQLFSTWCQLVSIAFDKGTIISLLLTLDSFPNISPQCRLLRLTAKPHLVI